HSIFDTYILRLGEETQRLQAAFAADTAFLDAPEWGAQIAQQPAVDPDDARFELLRHTVAALDVVAPDRRRQAIAYAIGHRQGLLFLVEGQQSSHRPEDLLLIDAAVGWQALDHSGRDEIAVFAPSRHGHRLPTGEDAAAFLARQLDVR